MAPSNDEKLAELQALTGVPVETVRCCVSRLTQARLICAFQRFTDLNSARRRRVISRPSTGTLRPPPRPSSPTPTQATTTRPPKPGRPPKSPRTTPALAPSTGDRPRSTLPPRARRSRHRGIATLSSLSSGGHGHGDDEDDDDDSDAKNRGDLFAGGEKSGLAVKDPTRGGERGEGSRNIINDILAKARE
jgi:hypothetical protein